MRALSGDPSAVSLSFDRLVVLEVVGQDDYEPLRPDVILAFHELCLVRDDDEWFMGQLDKDGSVSFFERTTDRVTVREAQRARPPGS
ncbi:hypothetical protein ACIQCR_35160 [Streptomyces sp. NPDC093249]|uniref:hypothetical protein n=1 Tax=unclassified Streptomyces TaxID=2593676 RepID=UPI0038096937